MPSPKPGTGRSLRAATGHGYRLTDGGRAGSTKAFRGAKSLSRHVRARLGGIARMQRSIGP